MSDVFSKAKRSEVMSCIRSRGNKDTELVLAKLFRRHKISGWRRHVQLRFTNDDSRMKASMADPGKIRGSKIKMRHFRVRPDFVFPKARLAIFVDGCFWHGCPRHATQPKNNHSFWRKKLAGNKARDRRVNRVMRSARWRVIRIWECALQRAIRNSRTAERLVRKIRQTLR